jgi:hypothetical protein
MSPGMFFGIANPSLPLMASVGLSSSLITHTRVVEFKHVCGEHLSKGRQWVVTSRTTGREWVPGLGDSCGVACVGMVTLTEGLVTAWD